MTMEDKPLITLRNANRLLIRNVALKAEDGDWRPGQAEQETADRDSRREHTVFYQCKANTLSVIRT